MQSNPQPPVSSLPIDVLKEIFEEVHISSPSHRGTPMNILAISSVCAAWRRTAYDMPAIWAYIPVTPPALTRHFIENARGAPLALCTDGPLVPEDSFVGQEVDEDTLAALTGVYDRISIVSARFYQAEDAAALLRGLDAGVQDRTVPLKVLVIATPPLNMPMGRGVPRGLRLDDMRLHGLCAAAHTIGLSGDVSIPFLSEPAPARPIMLSPSTTTLKLSASAHSVCRVIPSRLQALCDGSPSLASLTLARTLFTEVPEDRLPLPNLRRVELSTSHVPFLGGGSENIGEFDSIFSLPPECVLLVDVGRGHASPVGGPRCPFFWPLRFLRDRGCDGVTLTMGEPDRDNGATRLRWEAYCTRGRWPVSPPNPPFTAHDAPSKSCATRLEQAMETLCASSGTTALTVVCSTPLYAPCLRFRLGENLQALVTIRCPMGPLVRELQRRVPPALARIGIHSPAELEHAAGGGVRAMDRFYAMLCDLLCALGSGLDGRKVELRLDAAFKEAVRRVALCEAPVEGDGAALHQARLHYEASVESVLYEDHRA
ncbi:hypothetical protein BV25DRAFT_1916918 [Artomyces pyxidatus]|uniref:Uncharacterized protein n=1 Tax=Artomyces pyxidatus TaxID=48021 RepID=A0ACB8SZG8_9AGAM|nr:hypothetical protein BV25DRAFT_1916918 [Artomyces pyxidatus]